MRRRPILILAAVTSLALTGTTTTADSTTSDYQIIVNPATKVTEVDVAFVRGSFLKKVVEWGDGKTIHPVGLSRKYPATDRFTRGVLGKTPAQLKSYWAQKIFSGTGVPPPAVDTPAAAISFVLKTPGAIGYIPAGVDPGGARVVRLK